MDYSIIFTRHVPKIYALHDEITDKISLIKDQLIASVEHVEDVSLFDVIIAGPRLKTFPDAEGYARYRRSIMLNLLGKVPSLPMVNKFGVFDKTEISALEAGYKFMLTQKDYLLFEKRPLKAHLEKSSFDMKSPSTLLALKYFWIYLKYDNFNGVLSNTKPVRTALRHLYGTDFGKPATCSAQQYKMAREINISGFDMNSVLWFMGQL